MSDPLSVPTHVPKHEKQQLLVDEFPNKQQLCAN
jgi:hypothetical protein